MESRIDPNLSSRDNDLHVPAALVAFSILAADMAYFDEHVN